MSLPAPWADGSGGGGGLSIDVSGNGATSNTTLLLTNVTMTGNVAMGIEGGVQGPRVPLACALGGPRVVLCIFLLVCLFV